MSKTPRTDEQLKLEAFFDGIGIVETVEVEFAQQLETELAEARAEIERKDKLIEQMREALLAARGIIEEGSDDVEADLLQPDKVIGQIDAVLQSITGGTNE